MVQLPTSYVVVDVETTGLSPWRGDRVVEIGALRVSGGQIVGKFLQLVNPEMPIPPEVQAIHGITNEDVFDQPTMAEVLPGFFSFAANLPLVAHNAAFDRSFLESECRTCQMEHPDTRYLCTVELSRWLNPMLPRHNLDTLIRYFGIRVQARHRAFGDVLATQQLYEIFRGLHQRAVSHLGGT